MPDQLVTVPLPKALPCLRGPQAVHRLAMSFLPDLRGASRAIRADMGVLYRVSLPTEVDGRSGMVAIRFRSPVAIEGSQVLAGPDRLEPGQRITVRVVAEKRRETVDGKSVSRFVGDEEAQEWATLLLARNGLQVTDLVVSPRWSFGAPGSGGARRRAAPPSEALGHKPRFFTLRDLTAQVAAVQGDGSVFLTGIGRGKAYGYGMPLVL